MGFFYSVVRVSMESIIPLLFILLIAALPMLLAFGFVWLKSPKSNNYDTTSDSDESQSRAETRAQPIIKSKNFNAWASVAVFLMIIIAVWNMSSEDGYLIGKLVAGLLKVIFYALGAIK